MGQILKDNIRQLIVDSAINDLYENGVQGASMRKIASDANMTVGNLYRYFKNKDELVNYIIEPVINKISLVLQKNTNQTLDLKNNQFDINEMTYEEFLRTFDDIAVELCNLYYQHRRVFIIVLKSQTMNALFLDWCVEVIDRYISHRVTRDNVNKNMIRQLSRMYAVSLFAGIIDVFLHNKLEKDELERALKFYFKTCLTIVNINFNQLEV